MLNEIVRENAHVIVYLLVEPTKDLGTILRCFQTGWAHHIIHTIHCRIKNRFNG